MTHPAPPPYLGRHQPNEPAAQQQQYEPGSSAAPLTGGAASLLRRRGGEVLAITALAVAVAAGVMGGIALARQPESPTAPTPTPTPAQVPPSAADVATAKKLACDAWSSASTALNAARRPFVESPPNWDDPITVNALVRAQAGALVQIEYLRQHVPSATPADVAGPIADYIAAAIDTVAADGQQQPAAVANAAAERGTAAAAKIRAACGIS